MLLAESLWSDQVLLTSSVVQGVVVVGALLRAPWRLVAANSLRTHLIFGAAVALMLLWRISGPVAPDVQLHLLGITTVTLLLGLPLAVLAGTLTSVGLALVGWLPAPLLLGHALVNTTVPAALTAATLHLVVRHGPRNLFMYMLGVGFFGGGFSMLASVCCSILLLALSGNGDVLQEWMSPLLLLAMFPEGFLNGAVVSSLAVYRPDWLKTFDDRHYLDEV